MNNEVSNFKWCLRSDVTSNTVTDEIEELKKAFWVRINEFRNYLVSNKGVVNCIKPKQLGLDKKKTSDNARFKMSNGYRPFMNRLVALYFLTVPDIYMDINDSNAIYACYIKKYKTEGVVDNNVLNIAWRTPKDSRKAFIAENHVFHKVDQYGLDGILIKTWISAQVAGTELNLRWESIQHCCRGWGQTYSGYNWKYTNPERLLESRAYKETMRPQYKEALERGEFRKIGLIETDDFSIDFSHFYMYMDGS